MFWSICFIWNCCFKNTSIIRISIFELWEHEKNFHHAPFFYLQQFNSFQSLSFFVFLCYFTIFKDFLLVNFYVFHVKDLEFLLEHKFCSHSLDLTSTMCLSLRPSICPSFKSTCCCFFLCNINTFNIKSFTKYFVYLCFAFYHVLVGKF